MINLSRILLTTYSLVFDKHGWGGWFLKPQSLTAQVNIIKENENMVKYLPLINSPKLSIVSWKGHSWMLLCKCKIAAGINDAGGKFVTGISDTGGKFFHHFR
jgi:hypothetical protein